MKVIDLLNKIANGEEIPKKIKVNTTIYEYVDGIDYKNENGYYLFDNYILLTKEYLNMEVKIIEDTPKKLKDILMPDELKCFEDLKELVTRLSDEDIKIMVRLLLGNKYDELVERLNGK